ncbi:MAG: DUF2752 domain-containing protein [Phycisphaeraceae bacterium]|nr:DUF2752 domain-containing protein [Phycisphaeraceae bacterium]MCW5764114.1 DUF2752 domain-containing protein [Phycisphaeraceae bacterium]
MVLADDANGGRLRRRFAGAVVAAVTLLILVVAAWLNPSTDGHGTHTQLGLAPCSWAVTWNQPCATCGMTTSFAHAADGKLGASASVQPFGMLLALGSSVAFWGGCHIAVAGNRLGVVWMAMLRPRVVIAGVLLFALAWLYKILTWQG